MPVESTMPRSWNESSSLNVNRSDVLPNRKLSMMNVRSCCTRGSICNRWELVDKAMDEKLRRDNADERHVVGAAHHRTVAALADQPLHGGGIEEAVAFDARR